MGEEPVLVPPGGRAAAEEAAVPLPGVEAKVAEAFYVAPNWKLVWWRFRRHRLALASGAILLLVSVVAAIPGFFATQDPNEAISTELFVPIQAEERRVYTRWWYLRKRPEW